jgi:hypothetical protein
MNEGIRLKDALKTEIIGISTTPNDELFASQEVDPRESSNVFPIPNDEILNESKFTEEEVTVIVFDSVARLDSTIMTKNGLVGFITITLGSIKFTNGKEIILSESTKTETKRIIISPQGVFSEGIKFLKIDDKITYELMPTTRSKIDTFEELWKEIFLKEELPRIENEFINTKVIKEMNETTVLIKDGKLELTKTSLPFDIKNEELWFNIFGNIKNYQIDLNKAMNIISIGAARTNIEYEPYNEMGARRYQSYINLGRTKEDLRNKRYEIFKKGIFNFSRVDMLIPNHLDDIEKVIDRYNFISNFLRKMTSIFSNNPRFPQNIPIISTLEKYLRSLMGRREIVTKEIMKSY